MYQNNILSKKALEILEEGKICISRKELEREFKILDSLREKSFTEKKYYKYDPEDIYVVTQLSLLATNPELAKNKEALIEETDKIFAKQLMRSVLMAISMECESMGVEKDDYEEKAVLALSLVKEVPIAYYPNIIEFINEEEFSDQYYRGISFKKAYESNFCNVEKMKFDPDNYEKEKYYYRKMSLILLFRAFKVAIEENNLKKMYNGGLQIHLYNL